MLVDIPLAVTASRASSPTWHRWAERPTDMAIRTAPGHWEGDLLKDACNGSAVGILVERTTRLGLWSGWRETDVRSAREGFTKKLRNVPTLLRKERTNH